MHAVRKPWWQQATALVTVTTGGMVTGFNFVPGAAATMTTPTSVPVHLLALQQAAQPGALGDQAAGGLAGGSSSGVTGDAQLRSAIVNVAGYYLKLAGSRTPAQMEALIWGKASDDGADHGPSCAAFASLTLELAAQTVGQQSWVTGGSSYPWPLHDWADVRVDTNPASPGIESLVADAQAHDRWHPLGDGYRPKPGDWVLFDGHVEVVTGQSGGMLHTIGADSLPNLTVNAHSFGAPFSEQGVTGFVDNGRLQTAAATGPDAPSASGTAEGKASGASGTVSGGAGETAGGSAGSAATVPGVLTAGDLLGHAAVQAGSAQSAGSPGSGTSAAVPGLLPAASSAAAPAAKPTAASAARPAAPGSSTAGSATKSQPAEKAPASGKPQASAGRSYATPATKDQQAFISLVAPGAIAAQQRYGVPAAVTIAQAIEESAWGRSGLAAQYHNLFGIKGDGPAGSVSLPTSEYIGGKWESVDAQFRTYHNDAESIADHAELLATSGYYTRAMADRGVPDAFANDLTGVYATDPDYGANLIALMKLYNLYQYDSSASTSPAASAPSAARTTPATPAAAPTTPAAAPTSHTPPAGTPSRPDAGPASPAARASVPGVAAPALAPTPTAATAAGADASYRDGSPRIPGLVTPGPLAPTRTAAAPRHYSQGATSPIVTAPGGTGTGGTTAVRAAAPTAYVTRTASGGLTAPGRPAGAAVAPGRLSPGRVSPAARRYQADLPSAMTTAYFASAKAPLARGEHLYRDVAAGSGLSWELLAAADWMECKADPRRSPVHGEKLGAVNPDGTCYTTRTGALAQCARDLVELAGAVYGIDLAGRRPQSVRALAAAFAAFRWGAILQRHAVSPMEFPYSVAGLTAQHQKMHWPNIDAPDAPDRPGARFREPFGAVPVVLSLGYPATV